MKLPDGSILMHADVPYDPAKAHAYYLKTRKLHPRQKGNVREGEIKPSGKFTIVSGGKHVTLSAQALQEQKVYAAGRVTSITARLSKLNAELRKRVAKAKAGPTAAEKSKAAKAAKQYRDAHKQQLANKAKRAAAKAPPKKASTTTVASLRKQIDTAKSDLKTAVAKQRELAAAKKSG